MRPSEFEAVRPHLRGAVDDIDYFLNGVKEREKAKRETCELYDLMEAGKTPTEVEGLGKPPRLTKTQYMALVHGTKLRRRKRPDEPLDERRGEPLTDEEREAILADLDLGEPLSDAGRKALEFWARGGWRESSRQAAVWLRKAGETVAADGIDVALSRLPDEPRDATERSGCREAMRTAAERVRAILATCLEEQSPAATHSTDFRTMLSEQASPATGEEQANIKGGSATAEGRGNVADASPGGLFPVNIARVCESLYALADDVEFVANADNEWCREVWDHRANVQRLLVRLSAALNNGQLDRADCALGTLGVLRFVWNTIESIWRESDEDHWTLLARDIPDYRADEPYDSRLRLLSGELSEGAIAETADAIAKLEQEASSGTGDARSTELQLLALREMIAPRLTLPQLLRHLAAKLGQTTVNEVVPDTGHREGMSDKPQWDSDSGKLMFRGQEIRTVSGQATNVRKVLAAFQEQNWPRRIDDPLPGGKDQARLNDTVKSLNQNLTAVRFSADGSGAGYRWEPVPPA